MHRKILFGGLTGLLIVEPGCIKNAAEDEAGTDGTTDDTGTDGTTDDTGTDDGALVALGEVIVDQAPVSRPTLGRWPAVAFGGNQHLAVWEDHRARRPILYGGRVAIDGTALDPLGFPILDVAPEANFFSFEYRPSVGFDGVNFLVVSKAAGQIFAARVSPTGEVLDPGGIFIADHDSEGGWPSLAFDGEQYLLAWSNEGIYRARVQPDGTVLDPGGEFAYALSRSADATPVAVSFDGANHLLSWADHDDQGLDPVLYGGRIAMDGTLVDENPILINPIGVIHGPVAGFDGTNHVIACTGTGPEVPGQMPYEVWVTRVTPDGALLDPDGIFVIEEAPEFASIDRIDIAAGSGYSDVVWSRTNSGEGGSGADRIRGARIATDGSMSVHPPGTFPIGLEATVAVHPDGALLLHRDEGEPEIDYRAITGTRLDGAGLPVNGSVVTPASPASRQDVRGLASDGQNFFVLWTDTRDPMAQGKALFGTRVGVDGALDPTPIQFAKSPADLADIVFDGANYLTTWVWHTGGEGDGSPFNTVRVSPAGLRLDMMPLHPPLSSPYNSLAGASDGTNTLLVGMDIDSWQSQIAAVLLDQQGAAISAVVHILDIDEGHGELPAVSFDGLEYLVVWIETDGLVVGQRINQAGGLEGSRFILEDEHPITHVATAAGGGNHMVVWEHEGGTWAARVGPGGQVLDPGGYLVVAPDLAPDRCGFEPDIYTTGHCASVVFDGENFVVAWRAPSIPGTVSSLDLYAAKLSPDGEVSPPVVVSQGPEREGRPFLAVGDGVVLVAYNQFLPGAPYDTRRAVVRPLVP